MNIFFLAFDPRINAQYHCNKHVVKMIIEICQLLCATHHAMGSDNVPYKASHLNHPCAKWIRQSLSNYRYVLALGQCLLIEYNLRYGGSRIIHHYEQSTLQQITQNFDWSHIEYDYITSPSKIHKCTTILEWCKTYEPQGICDLGLTIPPCVMPDEYKQKQMKNESFEQSIERVINSYREYYKKDKKKFAVWSVRQNPDWFVYEESDSDTSSSNEETEMQSSKKIKVN